MSWFLRDLSIIWLGQYWILLGICLSIGALLTAAFSVTDSRKIGRSLWVACTIVLLAMGIHILEGYGSMPALKGGNPAFVQRDGDDLKIGGWIDTNMTWKVAWSVGSRPVKNVILASPGGDTESAKDIVKLLEAADVTATVRHNHACISACVRIFSAIGKMNVSGTGVLGFHATRESNGGHLDTKATRQMVEWAEAIEPSLRVYMEGCSKDPFSRTETFLITLDDIRAIANGKPERSCDAQADMKFSNKLSSDNAPE